LLQYLTAVFLDFDAHSGTLRCFNAGHYAPLILHAEGTSVELEGGGPPLPAMGGTSAISMPRKWNKTRKR
jgi:serine phosphatase RsbU (regulator of sigma subunit)